MSNSNDPFNYFLQKLHSLYPELSGHQLVQGYDSLSQIYQSNIPRPLKSEDEALAYCLARLPATLSVLKRVLQDYMQIAPAPESIVDYGFGPGASSFVFKSFFPQVNQIVGIELNPFMGKIAKKILGPDETTTKLLSDNFLTLPAVAADISIFSYSLGEVEINNALKVVEKTWNKTDHSFILIEPGTPKGFFTQSKIRQLLIEKGAYIVAPCGHQSVCPILKNTSDWCHFSAHVERTAIHRLLKQAHLSHEEEKYTYLIATKTPQDLSRNRIIRPPLSRHRHIAIDFCTSDGIKRQTFTKSKSLNYKDIQKLDWGDCL